MQLTDNIELRDMTVDVNGEAIPVLGKRAVMNMDTNNVLGIVSPRYKLIKNSELMEAIQPVVEELGMKPDPIVNSTRGGAVTFFKFFGNGNEELKAEIAKGDIVRFGVEFFNSYDGSMPIGYHIIAERLVCTNGLVVPKSIREITIRHSRSACTSRISNEFLGFYEKTVDAANMWEKWSNYVPERPRLVEFLDEQSDIGKRQEVKFIENYDVLPDKERNLWGFYNVLTYHLTHTLKTRKQDVRAWRQFDLTEKLSNRLNNFFPTPTIEV